MIDPAGTVKNAWLGASLSTTKGETTRKRNRACMARDLFPLGWKRGPDLSCGGTLGIECFECSTIRFRSGHRTMETSRAFRLRSATHQNAADAYRISKRRTQPRIDLRPLRDKFSQRGAHGAFRTGQRERYQSR